MNLTTKYWLVFCLVLFAGCGSGPTFEDYTKVEAERADLYYELVSYMSFEDVKEALSLKPDEFTIIEDAKSENREGIPPLNILRIKIPKVEVDKFQGAILITFLNDRLMEVWFYPENFEGFLKALEKQSQFGNEISKLNKGILIEPYTKIWSQKDYRGVNYIGWADIRLLKQTDAWVNQYS